jgi:hypothetical protein
MSGFRFFRRKKLMPGLTLNLSRSGPSLRLGGRGAGVTLGGRSGVRTTVGIPGTGIYYTKTAGGGRRVRRRAAPLRSTYSTPQTSTDYKGCLYVIGILVLLGATIASYGLVLIPVAIGVAGWIWFRRRRPDSIAQRILKQAQSSGPAEAVGLFNQALEVDPHGLKTLQACARWFSEHKCYQDAAEAYAGILHLHNDISAERMYVACLLGAGRVDEAIPRLEHIRAITPAGDSMEAAVLAELASAYLLKGQTSQAMAFIDLAPLRKRNLDIPLQMCLYLRGVGRYLDGDRRQAIADLERLYAVNPAYPDLISEKAAMKDGTFIFAPAEPYPAWYPVDHRETVLASEPQIDEHAASSATQDVAPLPADPTQDAATAVALIDSAVIPASAPSTATAPTISPDGAWLWDGTRWTPNSRRSGV